MADNAHPFTTIETVIMRNHGPEITVSTVYNPTLGYSTYVYDNADAEIDEVLHAKTSRRAAYYHRIKVERHARTKMSDG